jgi:hypothetical protein
MTIPSWCRVGAKVVCVRDGWDRHEVVDPRGQLTYAKQGGVYTIREIVIRAAGTGLLLAEVRNPISEAGSGAGMEVAFDVRCFRPVVDRSKEQDISEHFKPLLNVDHREDA